MESFAQLRHRHLVHGESISAIARDLNVSRNTVKKYLRSGEVPAYRRDSQPSPKLGAFEGQLKDWLQQDGQRPKAQRRSAKRLFEDLQRVGYSGAYDSVQRYVKGWKNGQPNVASDAFIPLYFPAGETCQFDWSHEQVELGGVIQTIKLGHFRLCYSRQLFLALANHYLFEPVACTPASGWEKGQVENQVGNVREWLFCPRPRFADFGEMNAWLAQRCRELASRPHPTEKERSIAASHS